MKLNKFLEKWSSALKGLWVGGAVYVVGGLAIFTYQVYWVAGGVVAVALSGNGEKLVSVVEQQVGSASEFWPLLAIGAISLGVAVWVMDVVAQRLGPPFSD